MAPEARHSPGKEAPGALRRYFLATRMIVPSSMFAQ